MAISGYRLRLAGSRSWRRDLHPLLGETIAVIEIVATLTVIAVALFGSQTLSDRAFRLLRWFRNSPGHEGQDQNSMPR